MTTNEVNLRVNEFLRGQQSRLRINDAAREHGQIRAFQNNTYDLDQGRPDRSSCATRTTAASRACSQDGTPVELQFTIVNTSYPEGKTAYNTISEIAGSATRRTRS